MPDLNFSGVRQIGEPKRLKRHDRLKKDDRFPFVPAFDQDTGR